MSTLVFDTHSFVKKLTAAGMPEVQAEILATEQAHLIENRLATKQDIEQLRKDMESMKRETINEMTIRLGGMLVIAMGALATILKLLT